MRARSIVLLVIALAFAADPVVGLFSRSSAPRTADADLLRQRAVPLDMAAPYAAEAYRFLDGAVRQASIVQLGESIHVTAEFPHARLPLIRYLHEQMSFDVLALEGSLTQAWLAQEYLYGATDDGPARITRAQQLAWFKLWNTREMADVMAYVDATRGTAQPLYLTSFDVQTGASAEFGMQPAVLDALYDSLAAFDVPTAGGLSRNDFVTALSPVVQCAIGSPDGLGPAKGPALQSIQQLETWIAQIRPTLKTKRPPAHVAALDLIPDNLRDHVDLCEHATQWQRRRDELNADNALVLRANVSSSHKVILWAHHSHVAYNSTGGRLPSMGQHLRDRIGEDVYTVGLFAGHGRFLDVAPLSVHELPPLRGVGIERLLDAVERRSYFVDLRSLPIDDPSAGWMITQSSRMEGRRTTSAVLAKDFDAAIYIAHVSPGSDMMPRGAIMVLQVFGVLVDHLLGATIIVIALVLSIVRWIHLRVVRRKERRSTR